LIYPKKIITGEEVMEMIEGMSFLAQAENRETFFKRIASFLPTLDPRYKAIEKAYDFAKDAFREKYRKGGDRYFEHLRGVALILIDYLRVKNYRLIIAALLHDIVEDIPSWTIERIRGEFDDDVALLVEWLTKPPPEKFSSEEERDEAYYNRFAFAPREFFLIKLADRLHNLITLWPYPPKKRTRKIEETRRYFLPYAEQHLILLHELEEIVDKLEKS